MDTSLSLHCSCTMKIIYCLPSNLIIFCQLITRQITDRTPTVKVPVEEFILETEHLELDTLPVIQCRYSLSGRSLCCN